MSTTIYIEGGGQGQLLDTLFREGWNAFFQTAGLKGRMPKVVRGRGRAQTFDLFCLAIDNPRRAGLPLLLVDSEAPLAGHHTAWQHLEHHDGWQRPRGAGDDQAFLMVEMMETWFLADQDLLRRYFGPELRESAIRAWPSLEEVAKASVRAALDRATAACNTRYSKGKVSFELLAGLNPVLVEQSCPQARRLLDRLRAP